MNNAVFTANYGQAPLRNADECLIDAHWLLGLSGGNNQTYINGLTATGTNQATALPIGSNYQNVVLASVPSGTGISLPLALAGTRIVIYNHDAADSLTIYPSVKNNPTTGAQDTFMTTSGAATSISLAHGAATSFTCAVNGVWN